VQEKGIYVSGEEKIVLASDPDLARRIGKRRDPNPVLLTVKVEQTIENSVVYRQVGEELFLADFIPAGTFSGPALPKEKAESAKKAPDEARPFRPDPGTFFLDPTRVAPDDRHKESQKKRRDQDWKKERRQQRKHKERSRGSF
jgi:putative RNA 2'-phosphotransferase